MLFLVLPFETILFTQTLQGTRSASEYVFRNPDSQATFSSIVKVTSSNPSGGDIDVAEPNGNNSCPYYEGSGFCNPNPVSDSEFPTCGESGGTCPLPGSGFGPSFTYGNNSDSWPTVSDGWK